MTRSSSKCAGRVLVAGATGKLGTVVVRLLREQGRTVRALTRRREYAIPLEALGAEVAVGDLRNRSSLERACQDVDAVVASAHAALGRGSNSPQSVDRDGHRDLVAAARAANVRHFVYVGATGASPEHPIDFFRIKRATEDCVEASGLPYTIVRGSVFMETWVEILGRAILEKGRVMLFGSGSTRWNYVSVKDMGRFIVMALHDGRLHNRAIEVGGPENLTQTQIVEMIERRAGRSARHTHLPVPFLRAMGTAARSLHPGIGRMLKLGALLGSTEGLFDMRETSKEFDIEPTRMEDVIKQWVESKSTGGTGVGRPLQSAEAACPNARN